MYLIKYHKVVLNLFTVLIYIGTLTACARDLQIRYRRETRSHAFVLRRKFHNKHAYICIHIYISLHTVL